MTTATPPHKKSEIARQLQIFKDARKLIASPKAWIQGRSKWRQARTVKGKLVVVDCYCARGAIDQAATGDPHHEAHDDLYATFCEYSGVDRLAKPPTLYLPSRIHTWNDNTNTRKRDVLEAFDNVIAALESKLA